MQTQRVLILSSRFGDGHYQAGEAIKAELLSQFSGRVAVSHLDFGTFFFKKTDYLMRTAYLKMVKNTPEIWKIIFEKTEGFSFNSILKLVYGSGSQKLLSFIQRFDPDVIITTHFIPAGILGEYRRQGRLSIPLVTVITDYTVHGVWINPGVDRYIVGCKDAYGRLLNSGILPDDIAISGIPVRPGFGNKTTKDNARQRLGISKDCRIVLIMGGSCGLPGRDRNIIENLLDSVKTKTINFLIVCGSDNASYKSLVKKITTNSGINAKLFGYVENIPELMAAADLLITKGGALTISEALTIGLPMIIYKPIPGHEDGNAFYVEKGRAGIKVNSSQELSRIVLELLSDYRKLEEMSIAARKLSALNSSAVAVQAIMSLVNSRSVSRKQLLKQDFK